MRRSSTGLAALLLLLVVGRLPASQALFGWGDDEPPETDLTRPVFSYSAQQGRPRREGPRWPSGGTAEHVAPRPQASGRV